jgi:hypothetical protein
MASGWAGNPSSPSKKKLNKTKNPKNNSKWLKIGWVFLLN